MPTPPAPIHPSASHASSLGEGQWAESLAHEGKATYGHVPNITEADLSQYTDSTFASRYVSNPISKHHLPRTGTPANVVYQLIKDVRALDATPRLNLASFVTTWMEPEARELMADSLDVNYVDTEEYPSSTELQNRCVTMLARLYNSPAVHAHGRGDAIGTATVGSSEAIMLGALSLKKLWQARRRAAGLPTDKPNLVMGSQAHVCWQKFCRYFDVEERYVFAEGDRTAPTAELMRPLLDENTIGVASILGSTYTGEFEDVAALSALLDEVHEAHGWDIRIHVDAASGGFIAPFLYPDLVWDFKLPRVASINVSGHKYGLVYPGVGWVLWRDEAALSPELVFEENYLGSLERSITLNFSKGASQIVAQYYQFLRLGRAGYTKIMINLDHVKRRLTARLRATRHFHILSPEVGVPVVAFRLKTLDSPRPYDEHDIADRLRMRGWVLPAYTLPPKLEDTTVLRVTIREDLSVQLADELVRDILHAIDYLDDHFAVLEEAGGKAKPGGAGAKAAEGAAPPRPSRRNAHRGTRPLVRTDPRHKKEIHPC